MRLFYFVTAVVNVAVFLGIMYRISFVKDRRTYSRHLFLTDPRIKTQRLSNSAGYLDIDYPIEIPVGRIPTVEMTFHETSRFSLSSNDSTANWETLFTNQFGTGFQHLGPYHFRFISGAYHALHCLYKAQLALDKPDHLEDPDHHFAHCLIYWRQLFLCNADLTLEDGDFMRRNLTTDRIGPTRRCRDWSTVAAWVNENSREWARYNGVELDI